MTHDVPRRTLSEFPLEHVLRLPGGRTVEWEAVGDGEPLIWVEGGPGFPAHLARPDVALVADRFRCHLVNAPGIGRTSPPAPPSDYSLDSHVAFFESVRNALGLGPVTVMGHSWGGLVAVAWAIQHSASVSRLIVIDGYLGDASVDPAHAAAERDAALHRLRDRPWLGAALGAIETETDDELEMIEGFSPAWPLYFAEPESPAARSHVERIRRELRWNMDVANAWAPEPPIDLRPQLGRIRCPTLVIVGEHDFICGPVWNRPIADGIRGARFELIRGAGHLPQYERPAAFRAVIDDWLEG
jgi:proline iminopeptidase